MAATITVNPNQIAASFMNFRLSKAKLKIEGVETIPKSKQSLKCET